MLCIKKKLPALWLKWDIDHGDLLKNMRSNKQITINHSIESHCRSFDFRIDGTNCDMFRGHGIHYERMSKLSMILHGWLIHFPGWMARKKQQTALDCWLLMFWHLNPQVVYRSNAIHIIIFDVQFVILRLSCGWMEGWMMSSLLGSSGRVSNNLYIPYLL